ncbi:MAG: FimB/Mfa2 family fimbrial subunit [Tannerellaceae bacterium]|nr:FimB/Mfa2 family fimbrial subunit [Tannerellaceae bacterium]
MNVNTHISISKYTYLLYGWLFIVIPLLTGCIHEELPECDEDNDICVRFNFLYDYNMQYTDLFAEQVDHITFIIYSESGELEQITEIYREDMEENHTISLMLSPGWHTAVAWGNIHTDHYRLHTHETTSTHQLEMTCIENNTMTRVNPGTLFHASNTFPVVDGNQEPIPMEMMKNSNQIKVTIKGLTEEDFYEAKDRFILRLTSNNWRYNFANEISSDQAITYITELVKEEAPNEDPEEITVSFMFYPLRLLADDYDTVLTLQYRNPTGREAFIEKPLVPYLLKQEEKNVSITPATDQDNEYLNRQDTYEIPFTLGVDSNGNLQIKEWDGINQGGGL